MQSLNSIWKYVSNDYKLIKVLGQGTFGSVVYGKHRKSGTHVAIKYIKTNLSTHIECRNITRELSILR